MGNTFNDHLKVEVVDVVDHISRATDEDIDGIEIKMCSNERSFKRQKKNTERSYEAKQGLGVRVTFAPGYNSDFDVRMKMITHGKICGERLIENSRIHNVEGHTVLIEGEAINSRKDSHSPQFDRGTTGSSNPNETSELQKSAVKGTIEVTFEDVKDLRYYSTPKEQTYQRREKMACKAELTMGRQADAIRIPLERLVDAAMLACRGTTYTRIGI